MIGSIVKGMVYMFRVDEDDLLQVPRTIER